MAAVRRPALRTAGRPHVSVLVWDGASYKQCRQGPCDTIMTQRSACVLSALTPERGEAAPGSEHGGTSAIQMGSVRVQAIRRQLHVILLMLCAAAGLLIGCCVLLSWRLWTLTHSGKRAAEAERTDYALMSPSWWLLHG